MKWLLLVTAVLLGGGTLESVAARHVQRAFPKATNIAVQCQESDERGVGKCFVVFETHSRSGKRLGVFRKHYVCSLAHDACRPAR